MRTRFMIIVAFALVSALLFGCAGATPSSGPIEIQIENESERIAEARAVALRAQRAETPQDAIQLYRNALEIYRDMASVWNNLGVLLMDQQRYLDAAEAFATASELAPADPRPLYNLGLTWERASYLDDALTHYSNALQRDPRYQPALRAAIRAERILGKSSEETLRRIRIALGQEQNRTWREWLELQKPQVESEVYASRGSSRDDQGDRADADGRRR